MSVYLARHGESEWNVRRLTQGQTPHPPLTQQGLKQARMAAVALVDDAHARGVRLTRVLTSDLVRAVETAEVIGGLVGVAIEREPRLREQHLGELEGRGYDETWTVAMQHDWSDPTARISGGESVSDLHARVSSVVDEAGPGTVLVSHGDAIRAALAHVDGHAPGAGPWVEVPNGAVFRVDPAQQWRRVWPTDHGGRGMVDAAAPW